MPIYLFSGEGTTPDIPTTVRTGKMIIILVTIKRGEKKRKEKNNL